MAVTYGFYNSLNGDRTYNAEQMSAIFDGIITDGVFGSIGGALMTIAGEGMQVIVKTGKAWFNGTWTLNDAQMAIPVDTADVSLTRIDAVVLEVNSSVSVRENSIKIVKGTPSANPTKPTMAADEDLHQYALAYITVSSGVTSITAANIEVNVGKDDCPFITSVLQQTSITDLFNQWEAEFDAWFANIKAQLEGDVAANLQRQIDELKIGATAQEQYGLTSVLPNDYIEWVGKYNEYWWSLLQKSADVGYKADVLTNISSEYLLFSATNVSGVTATTISYSKNVTVSNDNVISLVSPASFTITKATNTESLLKSICSTLAANAPCYVTTTDYNNKAHVFYLPSGSTGATTSTGNGTVTYKYAAGSAYYIKLSDEPGTGSPYAQIVTTSTYEIPAGETTYEHSTDRNAYPDSGTQDGITYTYLGVPFEKFKENSETGSYVGTLSSEYGIGAQLTFNNPPTIVAIGSSYGTSIFIGKSAYGLCIYNLLSNTKAEYYTSVIWSDDGKTMNISASSVYRHIGCNAAGVTYQYVAIH